MSADPKAVDVLAAEVDAVVALMQSEPLCPLFLSLLDEPDDIPYEGSARFARKNPDWNEASPGSVPEWVDGDPIYPERPDTRRFFGNFANISRVFCIDTDDQAVIGRLRAAIAENMESEAFRVALSRIGGAP